MQAKSKICANNRNHKKMISAINKYGRADLAKKTGISQTMINQVCINWRSFSVNNARKVAKTLGLTLEECLNQD